MKERGNKRRNAFGYSYSRTVIRTKYQIHLNHQNFASRGNPNEPITPDPGAQTEEGHHGEGNDDEDAHPPALLLQLVLLPRPTAERNFFGPTGDLFEYNIFCNYCIIYEV